MATRNTTTCIPSAQPFSRLRKGDGTISLMQMVKRCIPTATPLISLADLRRTEQKSKKETCSSRLPSRPASFSRKYMPGTRSILRSRLLLLPRKEIAAR
jgi:hypothetical protein